MQGGELQVKLQAGLQGYRRTPTRSRPLMRCQPLCRPAVGSTIVVLWVSSTHCVNTREMLNGRPQPASQLPTHPNTCRHAGALTAHTQPRKQVLS